jgi:hypothetical protein
MNKGFFLFAIVTMLRNQIIHVFNFCTPSTFRHHSASNLCKLCQTQYYKCDASVPVLLYLVNTRATLEPQADNKSKG